MEEKGKRDFPEPTFQKICFSTICGAIRSGKEDHYYTLSIRSIVLAVASLCFISLLFCIPAMIIAKKAQDLDLQGYKEEAEKQANLARKLNIAAYIVVIVNTLIYVALTGVVIGVYYAYYTSIRDIYQ